VIRGFSDRDRLAIIQQLRLQEAGSRNVSEYLRETLRVFKSQGDDPDNQRRMTEVRQGIENAEARAHQIAAEINAWEQLR
jgi:hypothetical protein